MATLQLLQGYGSTLTDEAEIKEFLGRHGIQFERWNIPASIQALCANPTLDDVQKAAVLEAFRPQLDNLSENHGYISSDMVCLHPELPGLDDALANFDLEHFHTDDEVRFIVDGSGVFGFVSESGRRFLIEVHAGDYVVIPANAWHWFYLLENKTIKALRIFKDMSGWTPFYRDAEASS
jgi:1,2-dihydroxy-3-keto-5-methylthiopentene dioxygenase